MGDGFDETALIAAEMDCSVLEGGTAFCGVTQEHFAINGVTHQWPRGSHIKWFAGFDDLGAIRAADVRQCFTEALKEISGCCDVTHEMVASQHNANLLIILARMDGASGVLADCQIPMGNVSSDNTQLTMRLDTGERWGLSATPTGDMIDLYRVFLHEALHGHGLGHKPNSIRDPALIAPMYSPLLRNLQVADKQELVRRYGTPKPVVIPPVTPGSAPATIAVRMEVDAHGRTYTAAGMAKLKPLPITAMTGTGEP